MPRKKKVEAPAAEVEVKAAEAVEAPAKKTTRKTTAAKKTAAAPAAAETKKAAPKTKAEKAPVAAQAEVFIEYGGVQVSVDEIVKNAKAVVGEDKSVKIYVQPENSKAYIAFDDQSVSMDVFFCK